MNRLLSRAAFAAALATGLSGNAFAGAPQPDQRADDFVHACRGGVNKGDSCSIANEATDCPGSDCVLQASRRTVKATLTIIAHDGVTNWVNGVAANQAATVLLELRGLDGRPQILSATYQDLAVPTEPPQAPGHVIAIPIDEQSLRQIGTSAAGLLFIQPESTLVARLRDLFDEEGVPVLVGVNRKVDFADHTTDGLATVVRVKVNVQFLREAA